MKSFIHSHSYIFPLLSPHPTPIHLHHRTILCLLRGSGSALASFGIEWLDRFEERGRRWDGGGG